MLPVKFGPVSLRKWLLFWYLILKIKFSYASRNGVWNTFLTLCWLRLPKINRETPLAVEFWEYGISTFLLFELPLECFFWKFSPYILHFSPNLTHSHISVKLETSLKNHILSTASWPSHHKQSKFSILAFSLIDKMFFIQATAQGALCRCSQARLSALSIHHAQVEF